jgi:hypothetical protein
MDYLNFGYELVTELVGPGSVVPWWAWLALLTMIFGGLLAPVFGGGADSTAVGPAGGGVSRPH